MMTRLQERKLSVPHNIVIRYDDLVMSEGERNALKERLGVKKGVNKDVVIIPLSRLNSSKVRQKSFVESMEEAENIVENEMQNLPEKSLTPKLQSIFERKIDHPSMKFVLTEFPYRLSEIEEWRQKDLNKRVPLNNTNVLFVREKEPEKGLKEEIQDRKDEVENDRNVFMAFLDQRNIGEHMAEDDFDWDDAKRTNFALYGQEDEPQLLTLKRYRPAEEPSECEQCNPKIKRKIDENHAKSMSKYPGEMPGKEPNNTNNKVIPSSLITHIGDEDCELNDYDKVKIDPNVSYDEYLEPNEIRIKEDAKKVRIKIKTVKLEDEPKVKVEEFRRYNPRILDKYTDLEPEDLEDCKMAMDGHLLPVKIELIQNDEEDFKSLNKGQILRNNVVKSYCRMVNAKHMKLTKKTLCMSTAWYEFAVLFDATKEIPPEQLQEVYSSLVDFGDPFNKDVLYFPCKLGQNWFVACFRHTKADKKTFKVRFYDPLENMHLTSENDKIKLMNQLANTLEGVRKMLYPRLELNYVRDFQYTPKEYLCKDPSLSGIFSCLIMDSFSANRKFAGVVEERGKRWDTTRSNEYFRNVICFELLNGNLMCHAKFNRKW